MGLFQELKRRNVFRVAAAYVLAAWVLLQAIDFVLDAISAPNWILQVFILAAAAGFLVVLVFSWVFEVTPEGIKREKDIDRAQSIAPQTGRKLDRVIIAFLALAVVLLLADRFLEKNKKGSEPFSTSGHEMVNQDVSKKGSDPSSAPAKGKSIAVLPFLSLSSGPDDEYFADGLTEEILNALTQLPELLVTARTSSFYFKGQEVPIQEIAGKLGVANVVEGSVRRAGDRLRVTAQLIRAADGFHLWSESYDSTSADTIAVQEDIAEQIASAMNVVMDEGKRETMRRAGLRDVEAFIAMQKGNELMDKAHGDPDMLGMLRQANQYYEIVERRVPTYFLAYQLHSDLFIHQLMDGASGLERGVTEKAQVDEALEQARADHEAAVRYARSAEERSSAELDLAFISGDWRGMPARIERFAAQRGCSEPSWYVNVALPFGIAQKVLSRALAFTVCDPLSSSAWRQAARSQLWAGDVEAALQTAGKGMERVSSEWMSLQLISSLVAAGQFEQAGKETTGRLQVDGDILYSNLMIAAARGDRAAAGRLIEQYEQDPQANDFDRVSYYAWIGDRERANQAATRIDSHAYGSQDLLTALLWCLCGVPWDLSATPNFATAIEDSGLPWPPVTPIHFPLKK